MVLNNFGTSKCFTTGIALRIFSPSCKKCSISGDPSLCFYVNIAMCLIVPISITLSPSLAKITVIKAAGGSNITGSMNQGPSISKNDHP